MTAYKSRASTALKIAIKLRSRKLEQRAICNFGLQSLFLVNFKLKVHLLLGVPASLLFSEKGVVCQC